MKTMAERMKHTRQRLRGGPSILVVENEDEVRKLILEMLEGQRFEVNIAKDGPSALELGRNKKIDLLLTETEPGGMRAPELARLLYKGHPKMRILFMSGNFDEGFAYMLGDQAERLFLLKPFTRRTLLAKIEGILS